MSSQMTVIIAGIVLVVAIVVALVIMRRGDSRFTYDTQHGTAPRATEGEGNTAATAFKGRFSILTTGVGAMFAALAVKLWGMQMVSSDYYEKQANSNQTRTVTTPAVRGRILDRNGVGQLIREAVFKGRGTRENLKCGICGEHGGEPSSVEFCHFAGLNYVSCSPFRVPIARLAAAHAALKEA